MCRLEARLTISQQVMAWHRIGDQLSAEAMISLCLFVKNKHCHDANFIVTVGQRRGQSWHPDYSRFSVIASVLNESECLISPIS